MENFEWWVLEQKTHDDILEVLRSESKARPWCRYFLGDSPFHPGNLNSQCRIGYVPFNRCIQDRFFYVDKSRDPESLAAAGIVTQIVWDSDPASLPDGWQGVVRKSFDDAQDQHAKPNTLVALLAFTPGRFRGRGLSSLVLSKMRQHAQEKRYTWLLVPALLPSQFEKDKVGLTIQELANVKREDGSFYDYWLRVHTELGAEIIGSCASSHRFVFNLRDFSEYVSSTPIASTGEHVVSMDRDLALGSNGKNMWQLVFADLERDFVAFDWGCVWMKYEIA